MKKNKLAEYVQKLNRDRTIDENNLEICHGLVMCDGKTYDVYLCGDDEMFELDEFFQIGIDPTNDKFYKFYFDYDANDPDLGDVDYDHAYRVEEIEDIDEWL